MIAADTTSGDIIFWCGILIAGICILGFSIWLMRRWWFAKADTNADIGWSLQHLREMRGREQITEEEFEALKAKVIRQYRGGKGRKDGASHELRSGR